MSATSEQTDHFPQENGFDLNKHSRNYGSSKKCDASSINYGDLSRKGEKSRNLDAKCSLSNDEKSPLLILNGGEDQVIGYQSDHDAGIDACRHNGEQIESVSSTSGPLQTLSARDARLWLIARCLGYSSFFLLIALGIFCFIEANHSESSSVFAFAFSCILDSTGAAIVIWRSFSTNSPALSRIRELQAQVFIGCVFWLASMFILVRSVLYLTNLEEQDEQQSKFLYILLGVGGGLQLFFFVTKTPIAIVLKSHALVADGVNSLAACVLASAGITASVMKETSDKLSIADDLVGVIVSVSIAAYGTYLLHQVWSDPRAPELFGVSGLSFHIRCCSWSRKEPRSCDAENDEKSSLLPSSDTV